MSEFSDNPSSVEDEALARRVLARLGPGRVDGPLRMARLKGFTNRVYALDAPQGRFCLRIPGAGTAEIIDRHREAANARSAATAGVAPPVLYVDETGVMVTPLLDASSLSAKAFRADPGSIGRAAASLRQLHQHTAPFGGIFEAFATVETYAELLRSRAGAEHSGLAAAIEEAQPARAALALAPAKLCPCHCDTTGANMLDTGSRVWVIDWEYSGMNDPMWDLAYLSLQSDFDPRLDDALLTAYLGRPAQDAEAARLIVQKAACELLSAAWGFVQASGGNSAADFRAYAETTLLQCRARMRAGEFQRALLQLHRS